MLKSLQRSVVAVVVLFAVSAAGAQSTTDQALRNANLELTIANLSKTILALTERVAQLEARLEAMEKAGFVNPPLGTDGGDVDLEVDEADDAEAGELGDVIDGRVMRFMSFERRAMEERFFTEASQLRTEARSKETKAEGLERKKTDLNLCHGHTSWPACGCLNNELHKKHANERRIAQRELARQITKLRADANSCSARANRLESDARIPRQTIYGWDGSHNVVLHTDRNLESLLSKLDTEDAFITWIGDLKESNPDGGQTWLVRRIAAVEKPEGFVEEDE